MRRKLPLITRALLLPSLLLGGCASNIQQTSSVTGSDLGAIDQRRAALEQNAEAIHAFLSGEIAHTAGNFSEALQSFQRAADLVDQPVPEIDGAVAELHLQRGEVVEATAAFESLVAADDADALAKLTLGGLYEVQQRFADADAVYAAVPADSALALDAAVLRAALAVKLFPGPDALKSRSRAFEALTRRYRKESLVLTLLALSYEEEGRLDEALSVIKNAIRVDPARSGLLTELVRLLVLTQRYDEAVQTAKTLVRKEPDNPVAQRVLALAHSEQLRGSEGVFASPQRTGGDSLGTRLVLALLSLERSSYSGAAMSLHVLRLQDPTDYQLRLYLATVYSGQNRTNEALEQLQAIPPNAPAFVRARVLASMIHRQRKELDAAQRALQAAYEVTPRDPGVLLALAQLMKERKDSRAAVELMERHLERFSDQKSDTRILFMFASVLHDAGNPKRALAVIESILQVNPQHDEALNYAAYTLAERGQDLERATRYVEAALSREPQNGFYLDTRGYIHFQQREYLEAKKVFLKALTFSPQDAVITLHLARTYEQLKEEQPLAKLLGEQVEHLEEHVVGDGEQREALSQLTSMRAVWQKRRPELFEKRYPRPVVSELSVEEGT